MRLHTPIGSINAKVDKNKLVILSERPLKVLSSAALNGGLVKANGIVCIQFIEERDEEIHRNPDDFMKKAVVELRLCPEKVVALTTPTDLRNVEVSNQKLQDITLSAFVTAGANYLATAGETIASEQNALNIENPGTINIILLIDGDLTEGCMVDTVKTATEAKTVALRELDVRSNFSGDLASGTLTDTVVVACTERGTPIRYAGTATALGELIGKSVKASVKKALQKQSNVTPNRPLTQRLEERGLSLANMTALFSETHPTISGNSEKIGQFRKELKEVFSDTNVASSVIAALRLDDDAKLGLIPETTVTGRDKKSVVCGMLQTAMADCLSKKEVTPKQVRSDDLGLTVENRMGPYTRNILFTVMDVVYSNIVANHSNKYERV
jgi:adenosylcobinamide hydrolase